MSRTDKPTCGPMYKDALERHAGDSPDLIRVFAAGFVNGQAEKVYLGACRAAMFRPSQERSGMLLTLAEEAARRYGLALVSYVGRHNEVWLCRHFHAPDVIGLRDIEEDSPLWHERRAWLCGVPPDEVDREFHKRTGHGERCD